MYKGLTAHVLRLHPLPSVVLVKPRQEDFCAHVRDVLEGGRFLVMLLCCYVAVVTTAVAATDALLATLLAAKW